MSTDINTTGKTVLMRLPNFHTLDVRVERRIARVTINNSSINLMDATMLGELDQLAGWLATQGDAVRVVILQSAIPDFFLAHLGLGLIQAIVDDPDPDVALESFQGLVARYRALDQVTIAKVAGRVGGTGALSFVLAILSFRHFGDVYAVLLLSLWIGIGFIFLGVSENAVAVNERDFRGRGWYVVLGVMSVIAGGIVLVWLFDSILVLTLVSGVSLAILSVIQIVQAFQIRRDTKAARETFEALSEQAAA
jgi:hypothetical protein